MNAVYTKWKGALHYQLLNVYTYMTWRVQGYTAADVRVAGGVHSNLAQVRNEISYGGGGDAS
jgi:hypothetical protein